MNMTDEKKQAATDALKEGLKVGYEATKSKSLTWWERALWVVLAGIAYAAASLLSSCTVALAKLPDGTLTLSGSVVHPVTIQKGQ